MIVDFPHDFLWGTATSAYQIEGAATEDGRGPSIWDTLCATPGAIEDGATGAVASDHYHRVADDVALMRDLGVRAYRFSIAWPRVQPEGRGQPNSRGLDFYERLVDLLLEAGIEPMVTLYHWDLPQALQDRGGWAERDTAGRFADYAAICHKALGDRVQLWTTLNEPWCSAFLGHATGHHAPGIQDASASVTASHHLLLAHGMAVQALRAGTHELGGAGIVLNLFPVSAASDEAQDRAAAELIDGIQNRWWLDAILRGSYPADILRHFLERFAAPSIRPGDLETISEPIDLLGVNYYQPQVVRHSAEPADEPTPWPGAEHARLLPPAGEVTAMGWGIDEEGLTEVLVRLDQEYAAPPIYITENGAAFDDVVSEDGQVHDSRRVDFLRRHLRAARQAIDKGVDLRGYFVWSLLDNFEWACGYTKRFGIVYVQYETQDRIPKDSAMWYAEAIRRGGFEE